MLTDSLFLNVCIMIALGLLGITVIAGLIGYIAKKIAMKRGLDVEDSHPRPFVRVKGQNG